MARETSSAGMQYPATSYWTCSLTSIPRKVLWDAEQIMPPPFAALCDDDLLRKRQNQSFNAILGALSKSACTIRSLTIEAGRAITIPAIVSDYMAFPGMLLDFRSRTVPGPKLKIRALRRLKRLHLDLREEGIDPVDCHALRRRLKRVRGLGLTRILARLEQLEEIQIRLAPSQIAFGHGRYETTCIPLKSIFRGTTFARLHNLRLDSFWLEPDELCSFILSHQVTLAELTLTNINLGGTDEVERNTFIIEREESLRSAASLTEWKQVAQACQRLPKLMGLRIDGPSASTQWNPLSVFESEELEEEAMCGRENVLIGKDDGGVWGSLERLSLTSGTRRGDELEAQKLARWTTELHDELRRWL